MENPYELAYEIITNSSDWAYERFNQAIMDYVGSLLDGFHPIEMEMFGPPEEVKTMLPTAAGVYIFFDDQAGLRFIYVGQAKNIQKRLTTHHPVYGQGYCVICITLPAEEINEVEKRLIKHFATPLNIKLRPVLPMTINTAFSLGMYIGRRMAEYQESPY